LDKKNPLGIKLKANEIVTPETLAEFTNGRGLNDSENSPLVNFTRISPNSTNPRRNTIQKITIHHVAGVMSVESIGAIFASSARQASSNYGVDNSGRVGMYVEERNRAWTSSSAVNDNQAITIEVSNIAVGGDWPVGEVALAKTIELCIDICKRNGIAELNYTGNTNGNLTLHRFFAPTVCPGPYLESRMPYIAEQVNKALKEDEIVTQEQFNIMMDEWLRIQREKPASDWAAPEIEAARALGITDGSNPQGLATREQVIAMVVRSIK